MEAKNFKSLFSIFDWGKRGHTTPGAGAKDPVCGMTVDPQKAAAASAHAGKTYYFCCAPCRDKFEQEPGKYLTSS